MLKRFSIRFQLTVIIAAVTSLVLMASFSVFLWWDVGQFEQEKLREQFTTAEIIGRNGVAALTFEDPKAATELLSSLQAHSDVDAAAFYSAKGKRFATYLRAPELAGLLPSRPHATGSRLINDRLETTYAIMDHGEHVGTVFTSTNLSALKERESKFLLFIGITLVSALGLAVLLGIPSQRVVSKPILKLASTMRAVTEQKDYGIRMTYESRDEIGQVVRGFNGMLTEIQARDAALLQANDELEERVLKRTQLLEKEVQERKTKEEQLRISEKKLADFFESAPLGIMRVDSNGIVLAANRTKLEMLGYAHEEFVGRHATDFYPGCTQIGELLQDVNGGKSDRSCEANGQRKNGERRCIQINASPHFENGEFIYAGLFCRDVTLLKKAEESEHAKERAERANQAKSEFLSRMSHELRTPMNAILGFGQLLEMEPLEPKAAECVDQILKGGRHLLNLINEVLNISRIETGTVSISLEPVALETIIQEAVDMILPLAAQRNIEINSGIEQTKDVYVRADRQRLSQVVINILSNAVKYNRDGGLIGCSFERVENGRILIGIADQGNGISDSVADRLFVPFDRLGAEQSQVEGTGLGLALSKTLVEAMGGRIWLDREYSEQGSRFYIEFAEALVEEPAILLEVESTGAFADASEVEHTVLLIEDNLSNVKLIEQLLAAKPGTKLLVAMQGNLGIEFAREHHPDLILLDVNLPDISGYDVAVKLKEDAALARTPLLVISADATSPVRRKLQGIGVHGFLTKPLDVRLFMKLVDQLLTEEVRLIA